MALVTMMVSPFPTCPNDALNRGLRGTLLKVAQPQRTPTLSGFGLPIKRALALAIDHAEPHAFRCLKLVARAAN
jgi:hypothetical protein